MRFSRDPTKSIQVHSYMVRYLRIVLPVAALAVLLSVVLWPNFKKSSMYPKIENVIRKANFVLNPKMYSTDDQGNPFSIKAAAAEQISEMRAKLKDPSGKFVLEDGTQVEVKASFGDLKKKEDALNLSGSVDLKSENGYELHAPSAQVDLKERSAETFEPVKGKGPSGSIQSEDGVKIMADGTVTFKGKTKLTINKTRTVGDKNG